MPCQKPLFLQVAAFPIWGILRKNARNSPVGAEAYRRQERFAVTIVRLDPTQEMSVKSSVVSLEFAQQVVLDVLAAERPNVHS